MARNSGVMRAFGYRNFRLFWTGYLISNAGAWIQALAQAWLVKELTGSAGWMGAVGFVRAFPLILLAPLGGTLADRFPRKKILLVSQSVMLFNALLLGTLVLTDLAQVWHVLVVAMISAAAQAFEQPARQSMIPGLVKKEDLHAAISLNAIAFNGAAILGPSFVGILVPVIGLAGCFFLNAASYSAVFYALLHMEFPAVPARKQKAFWADLREGLRYIGNQPVVMALISMAAVNSFFARPYQQFIPYFTSEVFHDGIGMAGIMQSAPALGTIIFMLSVASLGNVPWKGKMLLGAGVGFSLFLIGFAWAPSAVWSLPLLVMVGGLNMTWQTTVNTLLQTETPDEMRGRVMSAYTVTAMAMMPFGQLPMGTSIDLIGAREALTLGALISLAFILYMGLIRVKAIRSLS